MDDDITGGWRTIMVAPGRVVFSVAEDSFDAAVRELRTAFSPELAVDRVGPDLGLLGDRAPTVREIAAACARRPLVFVRHLSVCRASVSPPAARDLVKVAAAARTVVAEHPGIVGGAGLAVQAWVSGSAEWGYGSGELFHRVADELTGAGIDVSRSGRPAVLSCCATADGVLIGLNRSADSVSDWPGGRVRLARHPAQVSRAEFKLEELFQTFQVRLPERGRAVDLGASPGGWTRILRDRGLRVWAVDPADLDHRVATDSGVRHVRTTAAEFLRSTDLTFDLAVNDMRMEPELSCRVMLDAAPRLRPAALAIITLKISSRRPVDTVRDCLDLLGRAYTVEHARQLHHNRHEVTVVARRTADRAPGRAADRVAGRRSDRTASRNSDRTPDRTFGRPAAARTGRGGQDRPRDRGR